MKFTKSKSGAWKQYLLPTILLCIALATSLTNSKLINHFNPSLIHIIIFFFTIFKPNLVPYFIILIIGLIKDSYEINILGFNALNFLLFQLFIESQRRLLKSKKSFAMIYGIFISSMFLSSLTFIALNLFTSNLNILELKAITKVFLTSTLTYPVIHYLLNKLYCFNINE